MSDENVRYANLIAADIVALNALIANRRSHVEGEQALLAEDQLRLEELEALLKHVGKAET